MVTSFKKKRQVSPAKKLWIVVGAFALLICCGALAFANFRLYQTKKELNYQIKNLQSKVEDLHSGNEKLQKGISNSQDQQYIEKVAREELDLQQPGEKVVSFVAAEGPQAESGGNKGNALESWLGWVGGLFKK